MRTTSYLHVIVLPAGDGIPETEVNFCHKADADNFLAQLPVSIGAFPVIRSFPDAVSRENYLESQS
jgi:hypothetical protein